MPPGAYDKEAEHYDRGRFTSPGGRLSAELDDAVVLELLAPVPGKTFLDMPTGTARSAIALARTGARVCGVDLSVEMLNRAKEKVAVEQSLQVEFFQADGRRMSFPDNSFDGICCLRLFHLISQSERPPFVKEFFRVLKPDGFLVVETPRILHAAGLPWVIAKITGKRRWHYLGRTERKRLFQGFQLVKVLGGYFPLLGVLAKRRFEVAPIANLLAHSWPRFFTRQAFLLFRKSDSQE